MKVLVTDSSGHLGEALVRTLLGAAIEEVIACGGGAEIAEDEVLSHAVVKLSHEKLLVKEKKGSTRK
jgi:hypothetical protein